MPFLIVLLALLLTTGVRPAAANVGEAYGFGSRTASLAGAGASWGFEGYASYSNPAALALVGEKRLIMSWGLLDMAPSFTPINNVVVENEYTSDKIRQGDVDTEYRNTFGQAFGLAFQLAPQAWGLTFGLTWYLPIEHTAYMDTGETFVPEYLLYRSRTQRPQLDLGLGAEPKPDFFIGLGIHLAYSLTTNASVFLQANEDKPSTMRFASSLKPRAAPYFGLLYAPDHGFAGATNPRDVDGGPYTIGGVLRLPVKSANHMSMKSGARAFGSLAALDFNLTAASALFYDPLTLELGGSLRYLPHARALLQLDYQAWSKYEPPTIDIQDPTEEGCSGTSCGVNVSGSKNPAFTFRDIVIPRLGHELLLGKTALRLGYAFRPSIIRGVPTGAGNFLDPPKHMFSAGVGFQFDHFLGFDAPCNLDLHAAYQRLVTQRVAKAPGDEEGQGSGDIKIGAPGYDAGGKIYGGGLSLTLAF